MGRLWVYPLPIMAFEKRLEIDAGTLEFQFSANVFPMGFNGFG